MKRLGIAFFILVIMGVAGWLYLLQGEASSDGDNEEAILQVVNAEDSVIVEGRVVPQCYSHWSFATSGVISEVKVSQGAHVAQGDVLVRLEGSRSPPGVGEEAP